MGTIQNKIHKYCADWKEHTDINLTCIETLATLWNFSLSLEFPSLEILIDL